MDFDLSTAVEVEDDQSGDFDLGTATPLYDNDQNLENVYREDVNEVISAPQNLNAEEVMYLDDVRNRGKDKSNYLGFAQVPVDYASSFAKGAANTAITIPFTMEGSTRMQVGEARAEILSRPFKFSDLGYVFDPIKSPSDVAKSNATIARIFMSREDELAEVMEAKKLAVSGRKVIDKNRKWIEDNGFQRPEGGKGVAFDLGGAGTTIGFSVGLSLLTKNPAAAAGLFGAIQKSDTYVEARDAGFSIDDADTLSSVMGMAEGGLEFIGMSYFLKAGAASGAVKRLGFRALEEAMQEGSQQTAEEILAQTSGMREVDLEGGIGRVAYSMMIGGIAGGSVSAMVEIGTRSAQEEDIDISQETIQKIAESVAKSPQDIVDAFAEIIDQEASPLTMDEQSSGQVAGIIQQFFNGEDVDISTLSEKDRAIATDILNNVEQSLEEIKAQTGDNILPVPRKSYRTLAEFIKVNGGLKVDTGEARRFTRKESPQLKGVANRNGTLSLDDAREMAAEAGYISDEADINDFLYALENEAIGIPSIARTDMEAYQAREDIIEYNDRVAYENELILESVKQVKSFKAAFKKGVRAAKKDTKAAQEAVISALDASPLSDNDKAKFIKAIKNIQTPGQLRKAAPEIQRRVEELLNREALRTQKATLTKLLSKKSIGTQTVSGKKKGKFDVETQERLDELSKLWSMTNEQALQRVDDSIWEGLDPLQSKIVGIKAFPKEATATDVAMVIAEVKAIKELGLAKAQALFDMNASIAKQARDEISGFINRKGDILENPPKQTLRRSAAKSVRGIFSRLSESWDDIIDRVAPQSTADKYLDVTMEVQRMKGIRRAQGDKLIKSIMDVYGFKTPQQALEFMDDSNVVVNIGKYVDMKGRTRTLKYSKSEARKLWMEAQDKKLLEQTIQSENGNAYTDEMLSDIFGILNEQDFAFARAQLDIYEDFYDQINEVYKRVYGVNLPKADFYSPIRRKVDGQEANQDAFLRDVQFRRAIATATGLKLRDKNASSALAKQSDIAVFNSHIAEMSHFISFREKTQLLDKIFMDGNLREEIEVAYGRDFMKQIDQEREAIAGIGNSNADVLSRTINTLNRNFATSVLGLKAKIGMSQLSSYFAYAENIPTSAFIGGTRDFFVNYKEAIKVLSTSELVRERGGSPEADIAKYGGLIESDSRLLKKIDRKRENLVDYSLIFTRLGDRAAIYVGGWPVYKYHIDNGATHEQAILEFEKQTARTQQSSDVDKMSILQKDSPIVRSLTMFMSAPMAQYRGEVRAFRKFFFKKEITKADFAKRLAIYHVLIPQFYQALANGILFGEWDNEDQFRALILGSLNGIPIIGDMVNKAFRSVQGKRNSEVGLFKWTNEVVDSLENVFDTAQSAIDGDFEAMLEILLDMGKTAVSTGAGLPVPQVEQAIEGTGDFLDQNYKTGVLKWLGFPDSVAEGDNDSGGSQRQSGQFKRMAF